MRILRHFAAIVICLIAVALFSLTCPGCVVDKQAAAEREAEIWVRKIDATYVVKVACNGTDSDGDGYVSCMLVYNSGGHEQVECAYGPLPWNTGCRQPKVAPPQINIHRHEAASSEREL